MIERGAAGCDSNVGERKANKYFLSDYLDDYGWNLGIYGRMRHLQSCIGMGLRP